MITLITTLIGYKLSLHAICVWQLFLDHNGELLGGVFVFVDEQHELVLKRLPADLAGGGRFRHVELLVFD